MTLILLILLLTRIDILNTWDTFLSSLSFLFPSWHLYGNITDHSVVDIQCAMSVMPLIINTSV